MGNICKNTYWGERSGSPSFIEVGPKDVDVKAEGAVCEVQLKQNWAYTTNAIINGMIVSNACTTTWYETAKSKVTTWKFQAGAIDKAALSLYDEIKAKKADFKDITNPFNVNSKINTKTKIGTRYMTLPIDVWCTTSDYVRYEWDQGPKVTTNPQKPEPEEEWEGPKVGDTSHLGSPETVRCSCPGKEDTSGGNCGGGAYEDYRNPPSDTLKYKDFKVSVSLKWTYTKIIAT